MSDAGDAPDGRDDASSAAILDRLFRTERPRLMSYVRRRIASAEDACDLVQEAFASFATARPSRLHGSPEAYLQRILRNTLINWLNKRRARHADRHIPIEDDHHPLRDPEQAWGIEADDMMNRYQAALGELPSRTREVFLLHRVDEISYGEIASRLAVSVKTVEYHMAKALAHLDKALNSE